MIMGTSLQADAYRGTRNLGKSVIRGSGLKHKDSRERQKAFPNSESSLDIPPSLPWFVWFYVNNTWDWGHTGFYHVQF
jgi:hypothetical protein